MMRIMVAAVVGVTACSAASAAPVAVPPAPGIASTAVQVAYRHCWWQYGERHCRRVGGYRYGAGSPDDYRVGTAEWYRAMERDDRLNKPGGRGR
jgi:hypothetical protein